MSIIPCRSIRSWSSEIPVGSRASTALFAICLALAAAGSVAGSEPEREGPPPNVAPSSPWLTHPLVDQGSSADGDGYLAQPAEVYLGDLEPEAALGEGAQHSHIQGEVFQQQVGTDAATREIGADRRATTFPEGPAPQLEDSADAAGDVVSNFNGIPFTGWIPPDTVMAVGSASLVEATNSHLSVYQKNGALVVGPVSYSTFFTPVLPAGWQGFLFDPKVVYNPVTNQFVTLMLGRDDVAQTSYFFVAISQTGDPAGSWWLYRLVANNTGAGGADSDSWADYAGLGVDSWGIYITTNLFRWTGGFKYSVLHSFNPAMLNGGSPSSWRFWNLQWPNNTLAFSLQPAHPHSIAGDSATFFVNSFFSSGSSLALWKMTGNRISSPTLVRSAVSVSSYDAIGGNVDQPGSSVDLDGGDARIQNAVYSDRRLWTTFTTDVFDNGTRSGTFIAKLNVDTNSVVAQRIYHATDAYFFYPAIVTAGGGADANVAVYLNWTQPSTTQYASAAVLALSSDLSTVLAFPNLKSGAGAYVRLDSGGRNRWGDYSGAGWDWYNDTAWGALEWATSNNQWSTRISEIELLDSVAPTGDRIGAYRPANRLFLMDADGSGTWTPATDASAQMGIAGDVPLIGDWNGDGDDDVGVYRPASRLFLLDFDESGGWTPATDRAYQFGVAGDVPLVGDWNGDGDDDIGAYRPAGRLFLLDFDESGTWTPATDRVFQMGLVGDTPLIGDWNGDGDDNIGIYRPSNRVFLLDFDEGGTWTPATDLGFLMGLIGDTPLSGDWNDDGDDNIGVYRPSNRVFLLDFDEGGTWTPATDLGYSFGLSGDRPITGSW